MVFPHASTVYTILQNWAVDFSRLFPRFIIAQGQNLPVQILIREKKVRGASSGSVVYMRSQIQKRNC